MNLFYTKTVFHKRLLEIFTLATFLLSFSAFAAVPDWQIVPNESNLSFTGTQNNSPLSGKFKNFSGEIKFDPGALSGSAVKIIIDMGSVSLSFKDIEDTLKSSDWFDVKLFPKATFEAHDFIKIGEDEFQAKGALTIRNKTIPLIVDFTRESYDDNKVKIKGTAMIKRSLFEVGKGEWNTDDVEDDVKVNFILTAVKKK